MTSQSIGGRRFQHFEMLDAVIASALQNIIMNPLLQDESESAGAKRPKLRTDSFAGDISF